MSDLENSFSQVQEILKLEYTPARSEALKKFLASLRWTSGRMRKVFWKKSLFLFAWIYFGHYFTHLTPEFHFELCRNLDKLGKDYNFLLNIWFRWSAKTAFWGKIKIIQAICYEERRYILFWSYVEDASKDNLFDIARELQDNEMLVRDFWQLYFEEKTTKNKNKTSKKTSIWNFLTTNWIRVQATAIQKSTRWKMFWWARPDLLVFDDFENNKTKKSSVVTKSVINYFDEMFWWIAPWAIWIFNCNKLSDSWSVAWLENKCDENAEWRKFEIAVRDKNEKITWPDKYVLTDKEAYALNEIRATDNKVFSLESVKRTMNKDWRKVFEQEMLNQPIVEWDRYFSDEIEIIDARINYLKWKPFEIDWKWRIWEKWELWRNYIIWCDVSEWVGLDSSTITIIDVDKNEQVAEFACNETDQLQLVDELLQASANYWECKIWVERNSVWAAVVMLIRERWMEHLLTVHQTFDQIQQVKVNRYWWNTNSATKPLMLAHFKQAFQNWEIIINSIPLLREMRWFSKRDARHSSFNINDELTNHFDRIIAICIANECREQALTWNVMVSR